MLKLLLLKSFRSIWTGFLLLLSVSLCSQEQGSNKRILLICAYDASFPTYPHQIEGLRDVLDLQHFDIDIEFIDSKRFPGTETMERFVRGMEAKIRVLRPYDLVIAADDNALRFIEHYGREFFGETPVVFFGINDIEYGLSMGRMGYVTGVIEHPSFQENVALMHKMFEDATRYHVIFDGLPTSTADWHTMRNDCILPPGVGLVSMDLSKMTFEDLYGTLERLDENDLVLIIAPYRDVSGKVLPFYESLSRIINHCPVPVFHIYQHGMGEGIIGGMVVSHFEQARVAAELGMQILSGKEVSQIPVVEKSPNRYYFDEQVIKRFAVSVSQLPEDAVWVNQDRSFFAQYRNWIIGISCVLIILTFLTIGFFSLWKQERGLRKKLQESELRNATLFENPFAIMFVLDPKTGKILNANDTAVEFYGYSRDELLSKTIFEINTLENEKIREILEGAVHYRQGRVYRFQHRLNQGVIKDVEVVIGPVLFNGELMVFSILRDISDVISREQQLEEAKNAAERANKAKDEFLSMMSHEMRTPLNPIVGILSILMDDELDPETKENFRMMYESALRLRTLIDNLLNFNKLSDDGLEFRVRTITVQHLLFIVKKIASASYAEHSIVLSEDEDHPIPENCWVETDPDLVIHILSNFIENACKFGGNSCVFVGANLLETSEESLFLEFYVEDSGEGIDSEKIECIFEPFVKFDNDQVLSSGIGLGLAISKKMAKLLDAQLDVQSKIGEGSRFSIRLWMKRAAQQEADANLSKDHFSI